VITAVRLRAPDPKREWGMRTFVSSKGRFYRAPLGQDPGTLQIVDDTDELAVLRSKPQFEILTFENEAAMHAFVQSEMERNVRSGGAPVRAAIQAPQPPRHSSPQSERRVEDLLPAAEDAAATAAPTEHGDDAVPTPGMRQPEVDPAPARGTRRGGGRRPAN